MGDVWLEAGDIVLTRGTRWLSKAIRFFTRRIGESRTQVNHAAVVTFSGWALNPARLAVITEALESVQRHTLRKQYAGRSSHIAIFRAKNLTTDERLRIAAEAEKYIGRSYGFIKILAHLGDWALQGAYVFRRLARMDRYPICSWLVAHAYKAVGKDFGVNAGAASPDDIWDFCTSHKDKYELVYALGPLPREV